MRVEIRWWRARRKLKKRRTNERKMEEATMKKTNRPVVIVFVTCKVCSPNIQETSAKNFFLTT
jgi:hypothetical protein